MNNQENDIELIERYFDNELSASESEALRQRLTNDPDLKKKFDQEKLLISAIRYNAINNNLQYLKEVEGKLGRVEKPQTSGNWYLYAAAACITLLIVAAIVLWPSQRSTDDLYADYFEPFPNVFQPTLRTERVADLRTEAFGAYEAENYDRAAALFTQLNEEQSDAGILMLLGNANLVIGKPELAQQNFNDLLAKYDELDIPAKWFLSLCHLKTGDTDKARVLLKDVQQSQSPYAAKAKALLDKLE